MRIALAQINPTVGDLKGNSAKILDFIHQAQQKDTDLVVFPEMAVCGYPPEDLLHKEHFLRDNMNALQMLAKQVKRTAAIIGFVDYDQKKNAYNAAAFIVDGKIRDVYRKQALPNYGVFDEKRYFAAGNKDKTFTLNGAKFLVNICEDIWVGKNVHKKEKLLINISSSPYDVGKLARREKILKDCARKNHLIVCYVNLVGGQDELVFDGGSVVFDARGKIVASGKQFEEDLVIVDLDVGKASRARTPLKPHKEDRFAQDERIYRALVLGTRDYMRKNGFQKAIIGISGGIDSALVAAVAVDAIGKENVVGVSMPSRFSSSGTKDDACRLAENLGIEFKEIPIESIFKAYLSELDRELGPEFGLAKENIQARIRGNILMSLSNRSGYLVLTTGNKSEVGVGYCTLYGDMSGGFAVIKDVPKTKVYDLARLRNIRTGPAKGIPSGIIERAPSAELRENQKDQDSLPPYDQLDRLLRAYVEEHKSLKQMCRMEDPAIVKQVISLVDRNEYKRRQAPPGVKITLRAFGKDWRLPITNKYREF